MWPRSPDTLCRARALPPTARPGSGLKANAALTSPDVGAHLNARRDEAITASLQTRCGLHRPGTGSNDGSSAQAR